MASTAVGDQSIAFYEENYYATASAEGLRMLKVGAIDKAKNITTLCGEIEHSRILEIGCGDGAILQRLAELQFGDNLYGIEISPTAVALTNEKSIKQLVECKLFDGANIPYRNDEFDLVVLSHVVEHLEYPRQLLREAGRVSKHVFIEVPLEDNLRAKRNYVAEIDNLGHINRYSPKTIRWLVQSCGFEVLHERVTLQRFEMLRSKHALGRKALLLYPPARIVVTLAPRVATSIFTCFGTLLCRKVTVK